MPRCRAGQGFWLRRMVGSVKNLVIKIMVPGCHSAACEVCHKSETFHNLRTGQTSVYSCYFWTRERFFNKEVIPSMRSARLFCILLISLVWSLCASATFTLSSSDGEQLYFGSSVAVSGNTIVVAGGGAVYLYVMPATGWVSMTQTAKLTASDGAYIVSVALFGNTVVAGANGSEEAFVYVEPSGGWANMTETAKLTASDGGAGDYFGSSVAIDNGAKTIVVGAVQNNSIGGPQQGPGKVYVFVKPSTGWASTTETASLAASDGVPGDDLGYSVSISGNTIAAGAPNAGSFYQGAVYVFVRSAGGWTSSSDTAKLTGTYVPYVDVIGQAVSINGNTILAGGFGLAYIYVEPAGGWTSTSTQSATLSDSGGRTSGCILEPCFGWSVSLSSGIAVVGCPGNLPHLPAVADIYVKPAGGWTNMTETKHVKSPVDGGDSSFAWAVGVSGDKVVVGYPNVYNQGRDVTNLFSMY